MRFQNENNQFQRVMRSYILIILFNFYMVFGLDGSPNSICYDQVRIERVIAIGPDQTKTVYDKKSVERCCRGYKEINGECKPVCETSCGSGTCVEPNVCECHKYFVPPLCIDIMCPAGYKGPNCNEECSRDTFGPNCENVCDCENGDCDSETGHCDCHEGWYGPSCSECKCSNGGICNSITGKCACPVGYTGKRCEDTCEEGFWGLNCSKRCNCKNYDCNLITGKCENDCTNGKFDNEMCLCDEGWAGETCDKKCECQNGKCNRSGDCECESGWQGKNCEEMCEEGYYGPGCAKICVITGPGNFLCDPINGSICKPGYNGTQCMNLCPEGTFGSGCEPCSCVNASKCNKFTGECECEPGWYGSKCDLPCPENTYGKKCEYECMCPKCRSTDGFCQCQTGWNGTHCREFCPLKYFSTATNRCVEVDYPQSTEIDTDTLIIAGTIISVALLSFCTIIIIVIVCVRTARKKMRTRIETERRYRALLYDRVYRPPSPIYEEIPDTNSYDPYNHLLHIPVEDGYLAPKELVFVQNKLYSSSVDNEYVPPENLRLKNPHTYFVSRNTLPRINTDHQLRSFRIKSTH